MSDHTIQSAFAPSLSVTDGHITTTSNQVAEHFGKRHDTVLRAIRNMECSDEYRLRNFAASSYLNEQGKEQPCYRMTRDGFVFLAMGFTGKDAAQWKEAYIDAFNRMEAELLAQHPQRTPYSILPGQTLSAEQADSLRTLLTTAAQQRHPDDTKAQGKFIMRGWSKLKAHFKVGYREIPTEEFVEAISILNRHALEGELLDAERTEPPRERSQEETDRMIVLCGIFASTIHIDLLKHFMATNGQHRTFGQQHRYLLSFDADCKPHVTPMRADEMIVSLSTLAERIAEPGGLLPSNKELAELASACSQRLASRMAAH